MIEVAPFSRKKRGLNWIFPESIKYQKVTLNTYFLYCRKDAIFFMATGFVSISLKIDMS